MSAIAIPGSERAVWAHIARYFLVLLSSLWLLHGFTFILFYLLPSPEFGIAGWAGIDPAVLESTRVRLGLGGSLQDQYIHHLGRLMKGDFGTTLAGFPVAQIFGARIRASLPQWLLAMALLLIVPVPAGMLYCRRRLNSAQRIVYRLSHFGFLPQFLAAVVFQALFVSIIAPIAPEALAPGLRAVLAALSGALLPGTTLFVATATSARTLFQQPFVRTYESLGMATGHIRLRLLRNVLYILRPLLGRVMLATVTGTIFAELLFGIPGAGHLFVEAVRQQDFALMQSYLFFSGGLALATSLVERT